MPEDPWDFYKRIGQPKFVVAPMVDQSELPWRLLCRRHGAQLCYTPMLHAGNFLTDELYRKTHFTTCPEDRPLIAQFCANEPETLFNAASLVANQCDAIDINLGCPQTIARRGKYGAYLQDDWDLVSSLIKSACRLPIPVTCKIRIFPEVRRTVEYAQMIQASGCTLLAIHGRTREQKGRTCGLADWDHIAAVKSALQIPVFANGSIRYFADIDRCLKCTGADGVMCAESNLSNPYLFENRQAPVWEPCLEYLNLVKDFYHYLDLCEDLHKCTDLDEAVSVVQRLKSRFLEISEKWLAQSLTEDAADSTPFWQCQPRFSALFQTSEWIEKRKCRKEFIVKQANELGISKHQVKREPVCTGASVIALMFDQGVVIAADTKLSYGRFSRYKGVSRLMRVNDNTILGVSGDYADYQYLQSIINGRQMGMNSSQMRGEFTPASMHTFLTSVLYARRSKLNPLWNSYVVCGVTERTKTPYLGTVNLYGVSYTNNFVATGLGSYLVQHYLEKKLEDCEKEGIKLNEADAALALRNCIEILYERDCLAYNEYELGVVTADNCVITGKHTVSGKWGHAGLITTRYEEFENKSVTRAEMI
ncbi:peptidase, T1 family [Trichinella nativa]|uniref:tRNA-dihydrouridine(16/17) synthase [NAD(P)(+)] n=1 Tax=Trichinella nativa TaxID=6335 RepID=A0A1Y3ER41_9BILA|nr:peptidase, T1 family [Trichinella nativa]